LARICAKIDANKTNLSENRDNEFMTAWYSLSLLLHLIAIALWLGGIVFFLVVSGPAVNGLETRIAIKTMNQGRIGLELISWTAIALLLLTGIVNLVLRSQPAAAPLGESYVVLLGAKLFVFGAMALHHGLQVFKYAPRIAALTAEVKTELTDWPEPLLSHWRRWFLLLKINAGLGPIAVLLGLALVRY
jgi:putative copper export protein